MTPGACTPVDPLLDWSYDDDDQHEDLPIAYGGPARKLAGPWPLIIPHHTASRPWVAEITGYHKTYRYARVFLKEERAASGRRFMLQPGRAYEVSDGNGERYFLIAPRFEGDKPFMMSPGWGPAFPGGKGVL